MPIDQENLVQYATPFRCPECTEQTFQTDANPGVAANFLDAECTSCGHALTAEEIAGQAAAIPPTAFAAMAAKYNRL